MLVTVGGMKAACNDVQLQKAIRPMHSRLVDNRMNLRETHSKKAASSIRVMVSGIVIRTRDLQPLKAYSWMVVTDGAKLSSVTSLGGRSLRRPQ